MEWFHGSRQKARADRKYLDHIRGGRAAAQTESRWVFITTDQYVHFFSTDMKLNSIEFNLQTHQSITWMTCVSSSC